MATKKPTMMAGADEPATLSGLCQPMAIAMASERGPSSQSRAAASVARESCTGLADVEGCGRPLTEDSRRRSGRWWLWW